MTIVKSMWKGTDLVSDYFSWLKEADWQQCCWEWSKLPKIQWGTRHYIVFERQVKLWCQLSSEHKYKEYRLKKLLAQVADAPRPDPLYPVLKHLASALLQEACLSQLRGGLAIYQALLLKEVFDIAAALTRSYSEWKFICDRWPGPFWENCEVVGMGYNHLRNLEEMKDFLSFIADTQPDSVSLVYFELCVLHAKTPEELVQMTPEATR